MVREPSWRSMTLVRGATKMAFKQASPKPKLLFQRGPQVALTKQIGSLPVISHYLDRLGIAEIIDRACPVRSVAHVTHGETIVALVANRLTSPHPLVHVHEWAQQWAVEEVLGCSPDHLNGDRLGRALDAIFPHLESIKGSVSLAAIAAFGIDAAVFHWDFTTLSFSSAYPETAQHASGPRVTRGHSKDGRDQDKQVQVGFATVADGAIPLHHTVMDGNAAEVTQLVDALKALRSVAQRDSFRLVGTRSWYRQPTSWRHARLALVWLPPCLHRKHFGESSWRLLRRGSPHCPMKASTNSGKRRTSAPRTAV